MRVLTNLHKRNIYTAMPYATLFYLVSGWSRASSRAGEPPREGWGLGQIRGVKFAEGGGKGVGGGKNGDRAAGNGSLQVRDAFFLPLLKL
jgi:hypothetical protein